jgi:3-isopropylmalate dehydratase small subunit
MAFRGKAFVYGDNVDTDVIIPARYLVVSDPAELAKHCMEDIDPEFVKKVQPGDVIVAGRNFGSGSSREHAPLAIKASGISCIIAASFARIFYRNCINMGLPILECPEAAAEIRPGDTVEVDLESGTITNVSSGESFTAAPYPPFMMDIMRAGGLIAKLRADRQARMAAGGCQ